MKKNYLTGFILLALIILSFVVICSLDEDKAFKLSIEDGIIEYLSGLFFFMAAIMLFAILLTLNQGRINTSFERRGIILFCCLDYSFCFVPERK